MALIQLGPSEQISSRALLGKGVPSEGLALLLPALEQGLPQIFQTKNYQSETGSAGSLRSLLKESAWQALQELLGFNELSRLQSLVCGSSKSGVVGDVLAWAEGLPSQHLALQLALYEVVENTGEKFSSRAGELRQVALGGGSLKQRLQYNLAHFQDHAMNPATVGGLAAGMWLGAGVRYLSLSRLSQVKGFFSANALGGQALARGAAFLSEVPGVVVAGKGLRQLSMGTQDWSLNTLSEETARLGLSLLVIKGIAGVAHRSLAMGGTMQAEAVAGSGLFTRVARATVPHGATGVGIYLAKPAEQFFFGDLGLGVGTSWVDAGFETLSFGVAGSLSRVALSPRMSSHLAHWQRRSYEMERGLARGVLQKIQEGQADRLVLDKSFGLSFAYGGKGSSGGHRGVRPVVPRPRSKRGEPDTNSRNRKKGARGSRHWTSVVSIKAEAQDCLAMVERLPFGEHQLSSLIVHEAWNAERLSELRSLALKKLRWIHQRRRLLFLENPSNSQDPYDILGLRIKVRQDGTIAQVRFSQTRSLSEIAQEFSSGFFKLAYYENLFFPFSPWGLKETGLDTLGIFELVAKREYDLVAEYFKG